MERKIPKSTAKNLKFGVVSSILSTLNKCMSYSTKSSLLLKNVFFNQERVQKIYKVERKNKSKY